MPVQRTQADSCRPKRRCWRYNRPSACFCCCWSAWAARMRTPTTGRRAAVGVLRGRYLEGLTVLHAQLPNVSARMGSHIGGPEPPEPRGVAKRATDQLTAIYRDELDDRRQFGVQYHFNHVG